MFVIIAGNVIDGLTLVGPFDDAEAANEYGDHYVASISNDNTFVVAELQDVKDVSYTSQLADYKATIKQLTAAGGEMFEALNRDGGSGFHSLIMWEMAVRNFVEKKEREGDS